MAISYTSHLSLIGGRKPLASTWGETVPDFKCNCGFFISAEVVDYEEFMEYAIKEHNEQHLAWRTAYVLGFFGGNDD